MTSPADGSVITPGSSIIIMLDEVVESASIGGVSAIGAGKMWVMNANSLNLGLGEQTLIIRWVNKDGSAGSDSVTWVIEFEDEFIQPEPEVDEYLEEMYNELSGSYTLAEVEYWDDGNLVLKLAPP